MARDIVHYNRRISDSLHPFVNAAIVSFVLLFVVAVWMFFDSDGYAALLDAVVTGLFVMAIGIPFVLSVRMKGATRRIPTAKAILHALAGKATFGDRAAVLALLDILKMSGRTSEITDEAHEKRGMRLPAPLSMEEMDFLQSEARERDRQYYQRIVDCDAENSGAIDTSAMPSIKEGDEFSTENNFDEALAAYQSTLESGKAEITADDSNIKAQDDFRLAVARIGLLAETLLFEGDFQRAIKFADVAIAEGSGDFWIPPKLGCYESTVTNITWIRSIRAHCGMLLGRTEAARAFYMQFTSDKRLVRTSWETSILRDFVRLRRAGYSDALMDEIEKHYADEGWTTGAVNHKIAPPTLTGDDAVYVTMHPDHIKSGDLLLGVGKTHEAMAAYLANLKKWAINLDKAPDREDWQQNLTEAADRIIHTIEGLFRAGRFIVALEFAEQATALAPQLLALRIVRGCALMLIGSRDDKARSLFLQYRGTSIRDKSWDAMVLEKFQELRKNKCNRPLMDELERTFAQVAAPPFVPIDVSTRSPQTRENGDALAAASDIKSGDILFGQSRFDEALVVYLRRLQACNSIIAQGKFNIQAIDDKGLLTRKISDVAFGFLLAGESAKALATVESSTFPSPLPPLLGIRRAHALLLQGRRDEAKAIYAQYRGKKVDAERSAETLITQDFAVLRAAGHIHLSMSEYETE